MRKLLFLLSINLLINKIGYSQNETYSKVRIHLNEQGQIPDLFHSDVLIDHFTKALDNAIDVELNQLDISKLIEKGIKHDILIADIKEKYLSKINDIRKGNQSESVCDLVNFSYGTMGHYHTYDEIIRNLDSMHAKYPNIVSAKVQIGLSIEGRAIYAVKISDNPSINEREQEGVAYFDALHHSREPMALESVLYYMWWLLENYGVDNDATYLIDNRELHFVPVVNPDGYVYNQMTNPQGGGMWRKNRRNNGDGSYGVDLNRNYSSSFGNPLGSSSNPSSDTYSGTSAFSEPETRAVRDYVQNIMPSAAFSCHSHGQKFLISPGCYYDSDNFEEYAEFSSEFIPNSFFGYGKVSEMLGYTSCGSTRHYMDDLGIYSWTPEIGFSFWESKDVLCSTVQAMLDPFKYVSFISGAYPKLNDIQISPPGFVIPNDTIEVQFRIKNRGVKFNSENVSIHIKSLASNCSIIDSVVYYDQIEPRSFKSGTFRLITSKDAILLDKISLEISIKEVGFTTDSELKEMLVGFQKVIFEDDAESGTSNWNSTSWDTTFIDHQSGAYCFSDSRYGNYEGNTSKTMRLIPEIDLSTTTNPFLQFNAKWSLENNSDFVSLEASTNEINWVVLNSYTSHQHWTQQKLSLVDFRGDRIYLRFKINSDRSVQSDGFYFDDFKVVDFEDITTSTDRLSLDSSINIYPNPTIGELSIKNNSLTIDQIDVIDITGKTLQTVKNSKTINVSSLSVGVYFVKIIMGKEIVIKKFIKQ